MRKSTTGGGPGRVDAPPREDESVITGPAEDYLKAIYELELAGGAASTNDIAARLSFAPASVTGMIRRLAEHGLLAYERYRGVTLTKAGRRAALRTLRRHRIIESYLVETLGYRWDNVHEEAERLEHWMSPVVEERMLRAIGDSKTCPHGHPIFEGDREEGVPLADVEEGARVRVLRFENEAEDLLHYLKDTGLAPGVEGVLSRAGEDEVIVDSSGSQHAVTRSVAETVSVVADPSPPPRTALPDQLVLGRERYGR